MMRPPPTKLRCSFCKEVTEFHYYRGNICAKCWEKIEEDSVKELEEKRRDSNAR